MSAANKIRVIKDRAAWRKRGWSAIPNELLLDKAMPWEARGAFGWLSLAADDPEFETTGQALADAGPRGRDHADRMLQSLERAGWLSRCRQLGADGVPEMVYTLHPEPVPEDERTGKRDLKSPKKRHRFPVSPGQSESLDGQVSPGQSESLDGQGDGDKHVSPGQSESLDGQGDGGSNPGRPGLHTSPLHIQDPPPWLPSLPDRADQGRANSGGGGDLSEAEQARVAEVWALVSSGRRPGRRAAGRLAPLVADALAEGWDPKSLAVKIQADWPDRVISLPGLLEKRLVDLPEAPTVDSAPSRPRPVVDDHQDRPAGSVTREQAAASLGPVRGSARIRLARGLLQDATADAALYIHDQVPELADGGGSRLTPDQIMDRLVEANGGSW